MLYVSICVSFTPTSVILLPGWSVFLSVVRVWGGGCGVLGFCLFVCLNKTSVPKLEDEHIGIFKFGD